MDARGMAVLKLVTGFLSAVRTRIAEQSQHITARIRLSAACSSHHTDARECFFSTP